MHDPRQFRYAYLHGFGSGPHSRKGVHLRDALAGSVEIGLLDLNVPSFREQTYSRILRSLDFLRDGDRPVRLIGSSMGGFLAARWVELHPGVVDRLLLLCPGFDLEARWPLLLGQESIRRWEREGVLDVDNGAGLRRPLNWEFVTDSRTHPAYPEVDCPTVIIHGTRDAIVPAEHSRAYVRGRPHVRLCEVDDDHSLCDSLDRITGEARRLFEIDVD